MNDLVAKASVLIEALPYIRTFFGKTFVIKYGGHAMSSEELKKTVMLDVILLKYVGVNPVVIHGGGPDINRYMNLLGKEPRFVQGLRVTDAETMEIAQMVLVGKINQEIVSLIGRYGGRAVGLSGKDGSLIMGRKKQPPLTTDGTPVDLGFVGEIERINPDLIHRLSSEGYIPVISSIGVGQDGESYNINADEVAGELAAALKAEKLIMLTDVDGISTDMNDPDSRISSLAVSRAQDMIADGTISGGMVPKVNACVHALQHGVGRTHIIDGRIQHSLLLEIFTDQGIGTMVVS